MNVCVKHCTPIALKKICQKTILNFPTCCIKPAKDQKKLIGLKFLAALKWKHCLSWCCENLGICSFLWSHANTL